MHGSFAGSTITAHRVRVRPDRLGAQGTVLAGGRYDGLIESLGGRPQPAVWLGAGSERLAMMIEAPSLETSTVAVVPSVSERRPRVRRSSPAFARGHLRRHGVSRHMKKRLSRANASGAKYALILEKMNWTPEKRS